MRYARDPPSPQSSPSTRARPGACTKRNLVGRPQDSSAFSAHFAIGQSATSQIGHTKGGIDGIVGFEGLDQLEVASGEGTFVVAGHAGGAGYKAQNNTLAVFHQYVASPASPPN